jgi:polysaccharide pyruvyl transferase WcaK-like protein
MKVVLTHAYSSTNSGDGLLVREAAGLVRSAFPDSKLTLIALDPSSFEASSFDRLMHPITGNDVRPGRTKVLAGGLWALTTRTRNEAVATALRDADLVVAVGGGYLRAKNPVEAIKMLAVHGPQLQYAGTPMVYLPQSIGPLRFGSSALIRARLKHAAAVYVRDDRSLNLMRSSEQTRRSPDMALLGLPAVWNAATTAAPGGTVGLVARALPGRRRQQDAYHQRLREILASLPGTELLVQAHARGNDDVDFYRTALSASGAFRTLREATMSGAPNRPSVVISVRLHGALEAIRNGVPSVHLSYERKGWGAFSDLAIAPYVHNVYDFDSNAVTKQASALRASSETYWSAVASATTRLTHSREALISDLASAAARQR